MADDPRIPPVEFLRRPEPSPSDRRDAFVLRRTIDRATGEIESLAEAHKRYRELGLRTPNDDAPAYYDA